MARQNIQTYTVFLSSNHIPYQSVIFCEPRGYSNYQAVEVDIKKFIYFCDQAEGINIVPCVNKWSDEKREQIKQFLSPPQKSQSYPELPVISFNIRERVSNEKSFIFFKRNVRTIEKYISFTGGRHRTRYLEYAGAKKIWVYCYKDDVKDLVEHCG